MIAIALEIQRYKQCMPQYTDALERLQGILALQGGWKERIEPCLHIEFEVAYSKWQVGTPLFADEPLRLSWGLFSKALAELRAITPVKGTGRDVIDRLLDHGLASPSCLEMLPADMITEGEACIHRLANTTGADHDSLVSLLHVILSPFFDKQAEPYRPWLEAIRWRRGICPICGAEPWMARLAHDNGRRLLACSWCRTEWSYPRLGCPFCGKGEPKARYFHLDTDMAHRVYSCQECRRYIKTVDERALGRPAILLIEEVVTSHLDALAIGEGYR
ncbi:MAG TPA: formate dehydrogenase accessory protein FdhE [Caldilineae bacterium]|nr:formate dehydrogenase accessory protein FdhE [Caldilineae bacterium]